TGPVARRRPVLRGHRGHRGGAERRTRGNRGTTGRLGQRPWVCRPLRRSPGPGPVSRARRRPPGTGPAHGEPALRRGPGAHHPVLARRPGHPPRRVLRRGRRRPASDTGAASPHPGPRGGFWPNRRPVRRGARWDGLMPVVDPDPEGQDLLDLVTYYRSVADEPGEIFLYVDSAGLTAERVNRS